MNGKRGLDEGEQEIINTNNFVVLSADYKKMLLDKIQLNNENSEINGHYSRIESTTKVKGEILSDGDFRIDGTSRDPLKPTVKS